MPTLKLVMRAVYLRKSLFPLPLLVLCLSLYDFDVSTFILVSPPVLFHRTSFLFLSSYCSVFLFIFDPS